MKRYARDLTLVAVILVICLATAVIAQALDKPTAAEDPEPVKTARVVETVGEDPEEPEKIEEALEAAGFFREDVPLTYELQDVLHTACAANGVPYEVGLGLIETESSFRSDAVSPAGCYGLTQLNPRYFPSGLSDAENIQAGIDFLGYQLERYDGDLAAALTAYNAGHDTGARGYARAVLAAAEKWSVDE